MNGRAMGADIETFAGVYKRNDGGVKRPDVVMKRLVLVQNKGCEYVEECAGTISRRLYKNKMQLSKPTVGGMYHL
jgi:hypothetical protein